MASETSANTCSSSCTVPNNPIKRVPSGLFAKRKCSFDQTYGVAKGVRLREFGDTTALKGTMVMTGFPSASLTSILTAGYLVEQLDLPLVGVMSSPFFPPRCILDKGVPCHPVRIFGDQRLCVIMCEFKLEPPEVANAVCDALLDFALRHSCSMILTVEGDPSKKPTVEENTLRDVLFVSTSQEFSNKMTSLTYKPIENGLISGMTGLILAEGPLRDVEVACLLSPTNPMYPEAYSAVAVVNAIAAFLSNIKIDTSQLEQKARVLQQSVTNMLKAESMSKMSPQSFMYA